jgi:hypothetical protein
VTVTIENNEVVIRLPLNDKPQLTSTGKSFMLASTGGWKPTTTVHQGKTVSVNVNVIVPAKS